jgi:hypothetical protein
MGGTAATRCYCPQCLFGVNRCQQQAGSKQGDEIMQRDLRSAPISARALVVAALGMAWLVPGAATAQQSQPQPMPPGSSGTLPSITEQKLDAVAKALQQVSDIKDDYQQKIEESPPADRKRLADEGNSALARAINDQGLSVEEYSSILVMAQNDPTVREKILQRIQPPAK